MKKLILFFFLIALTPIFANTIVLENETAYPSKKQKMAIQWASSAQEVNANNHALMHGEKLNTLQMVTQSGKIQLTIPKKAAYFRIVAWSTGGKEPDLHTNWVDIVPNKNYTLKGDHLVPTVLMIGMGC